MKTSRDLLKVFLPLSKDVPNRPWTLHFEVRKDHIWIRRWLSAKASGLGQ